MNQGKIINLNVRRQDFEDIYFKGKQGSLFFSPTTKSKTITTLVIVLIFIVLFLFKDHLSKDKVGVLYFVSFLFLLCAVYLSLAINKVSRWKKQVIHYLKTLENAEVYQIQFDDKTFSVNLNHQIEECEWGDFNYTEVDKEFISLEGKFNYMFPRKSMSDADYNTLKKATEKFIK